MNVPFIAQKSAIDAYQKCTDPEHQENVDKIVIAVLGAGPEEGEGQGEEQTDKQGPPQVPVLQVIDAALAMFGQQQYYISDFVGYGYQLSYLNICWLTIVSLGD